MARKPLYFEIFTTSLGALLLEISYTRIFSFKVFYYFTYLILGMGLLGIGAGGIAVAMSERLRRAPSERLVPIASFAGGASVLLSYLVVSPIQLNIAGDLTSPVEIAKLLLVAVLLTVTFFAVGIVVSTILSREPEAAQKLYGADLLGAALGCTLVVPLVSVLTPPRTVILAGLILAVAGLRLARASRLLSLVGWLTVLVLALPVTTGALLADPTVAKSKSFEDFRNAKVVEFSKWSPVFRIDVAKHPFYPGEVYLVFHDGQPGSGLRRFDGDFAPFAYLNKDPRALPFDVLPKEPRVLIIGAAGGHEVVASLFFKAGHVTGVELNPVTYSLLTKVYADVTGHLADNPRVTLVNGDGRWFLKQSREMYDLVWFVAPDSYAAMNAATSGAFVLSESYLYTAEMIQESLSHLSPEGVICTQFGEISYDRKPNRTTRYLATARAAFGEQGVTDFPSHVLVASAPGFPPFRELAVLLGKKPFRADQIQAFTARTNQIADGAVRYVPGRAIDGTAVNRVIGLGAGELPAFFEKYPYDVSAVHDDAPFFWHFARFRDLLASPLPNGSTVIDHEDAVAEQVTLAFLLVAAVLAALLLLLPLLTTRAAWSEMPHKASAVVYFGALGLGFMFLEVGLIQKLTLLLGYPTYSLSVTLFALLVFSGLGSLVSARHAASRNKVLFSALGGLAVLVLLAEVALPAIIDHAVGRALPVRVAVTIAVIAPMGLCLGAFMPLGLRSVARITTRSREYVAWAWAVNGFFSVIASVLSTILAMVVGFRVLLLLALAIYMVGALALARIPDRAARDSA
jgi:hypothetical protein